MELEFYKYQGTGNDFVIIDNRQLIFDKNNTKLVAQLCDRRFGIGADGLILLEHHHELDFKMVYYNSDGNLSSMCGNGGRCIVAFANHLGIISNRTSFMAIDGVHNAEIADSEVLLQMQNVDSILKYGDYSQLDTGSPHYVTTVEGIDSIDVKTKGAAIRYSDAYKSEGININFVERITDGHFKVRTYERGVEDETLSCGTGVTAVALAMHYIGETEKNLISLSTLGGLLKVKFESTSDGYKDIWLCGKAEQVFKGIFKW